MHTSRLVALIGVSLFLGACTMQQSAESPTAPTSSASSTEAWVMYSSEKMGISLKYPSTFMAIEDGESVIIKRNVDTTSDTITINKVSSTLAKEVEKHLYQASSIERHFSSPDQPVNTTIAHYQSGDANSWFMTYFITRESDTPSFPDYTEKHTAYDVIVADVEAFPSDATQLLSEPQQILSTLRFTK